MKSMKSTARMILFGCALPVAAWSMHVPSATDPSPASSPIDAVVRVDPQGHVVAFRSTEKLPADISNFVYDSLKNWQFRNPPVNGQKVTRPLILHLIMETFARADGKFDAKLSLVSTEVPKQLRSPDPGLTRTENRLGDGPVRVPVSQTIR